ncbi:hypothetical protein BLNAU_16814 [Blattamonas nauphoetae]|uniref:RRM domain-containing protein n=1 Tax=Blattamonas nauphoetae TaxID=2049346 RepID=A0ABQ9X810_9EUKA|nr:hypothetical protein BLNAU_16814 [Blattamonas nauphoetae]
MKQIQRIPLSSQQFTPSIPDSLSSPPFPLTLSHILPPPTLPDIVIDLQPRIKVKKTSVRKKNVFAAPTVTLNKKVPVQQPKKKKQKKDISVSSRGKQTNINPVPFSGPIPFSGQPSTTQFAASHSSSMADHLLPDPSILPSGQQRMINTSGINQTNTSSSIRASHALQVTRQASSGQEKSKSQTQQSSGKSQSVAHTAPSVTPWTNKSHHQLVFDYVPVGTVGHDLTLALSPRPYQCSSVNNIGRVQWIASFETVEECNSAAKNLTKVWALHPTIEVGFRVNKNTSIPIPRPVISFSSSNIVPSHPAQPASTPKKNEKKKKPTDVAPLLQVQAHPVPRSSNVSSPQLVLGHVQEYKRKDQCSSANTVGLTQPTPHDSPSAVIRHSILVRGLPVDGGVQLRQDFMSAMPEDVKRRTTNQKPEFLVQFSDVQGLERGKRRARELWGQSKTVTAHIFLSDTMIQQIVPIPSGSSMNAKQESKERKETQVSLPPSTTVDRHVLSVSGETPELMKTINALPSLLLPTIPIELTSLPIASLFSPFAPLCLIRVPSDNQTHQTWRVVFEHEEDAARGRDIVKQAKTLCGHPISVADDWETQLDQPTREICESDVFRIVRKTELNKSIAIPTIHTPQLFIANLPQGRGKGTILKALKVEDHTKFEVHNTILGKVFVSSFSDKTELKKALSHLENVWAIGENVCVGIGVDGVQLCRLEARKTGLLWMVVELGRLAFQQVRKMNKPPTVPTITATTPQPSQHHDLVITHLPTGTQTKRLQTLLGSSPPTKVKGLRSTKSSQNFVASFPNRASLLRAVEILQQTPELGPDVVFSFDPTDAGTGQVQPHNDIPTPQHSLPKTDIVSSTTLPSVTPPSATQPLPDHQTHLHPAQQNPTPKKNEKKKKPTDAIPLLPVTASPVPPSNSLCVPLSPPSVSFSSTLFNQRNQPPSSEKRQTGRQEEDENQNPLSHPKQTTHSLTNTDRTRLIHSAINTVPTAASKSAVLIPSDQLFLFNVPSHLSSIEVERSFREITPSCINVLISNQPQHILRFASVEECNRAAQNLESVWALDPAIQIAFLDKQNRLVSIPRPSPQRTLPSGPTEYPLVRQSSNPKVSVQPLSHTIQLSKGVPEPQHPTVSVTSSRSLSESHPYQLIISHYPLGTKKVRIASALEPHPPTSLECIPKRGVGQRFIASYSSDENLLCAVANLEKVWELGPDVKVSFAANGVEKELICRPQFQVEQRLINTSGINQTNSSSSIRASHVLEVTQQASSGIEKSKSQTQQSSVKTPSVAHAAPSVTPWTNKSHHQLVFDFVPVGTKGHDLTSALSPRPYQCSSVNNIGRVQWIVSFETVEECNAAAKNLTQVWELHPTIEVGFRVNKNTSIPIPRPSQPEPSHTRPSSSTTRQPITQPKQSTSSSPQLQPPKPKQASKDTGHSDEGQKRNKVKLVTPSTKSVPTPTSSKGTKTKPTPSTHPKDAPKPHQEMPSETRKGEHILFLTNISDEVSNADLVWLLGDMKGMRVEERNRKNGKREALIHFLAKRDLELGMKSTRSKTIGWTTFRIVDSSEVWGVSV